MAYSFGILLLNELAQGSGNTSGGRLGAGDIGGGNLVPPPKQIQISNLSGGTQFLVKFTASDTVVLERNKATWYRLYYLDAKEVAITNVVNAVPNSLVTPNYYAFQPGTQLAGKRHFVMDVPVAIGNTVTTQTLSTAPFLDGGWFYASGVNSAGQEGGLITPPVPLPIALSYASPDAEITSPAAPYTLSTVNGIQYATFAFTWSPATTATTVKTKYVQVFINNFANNGQLWEGPIFNNCISGSGPNTGSYVIECDRGTGGFPDPGAHTVTLYFVSLSSSYSHRPDPTSAPSVAIAGGIH